MSRRDRQEKIHKKIFRQLGLPGSKRGFELQFNWIFVLIAGGIILSFFFMVVRNQISVSRVEDSSAVQGDIDFLLRGSLGSRSSEKSVPLKARLDFRCDDGASQYIASGSLATSRYDYLAVFSPPFLDAHEVIIKTDFFEAPFHVMPFTFLTSKDVSYVFVGDGPDVRSLFSGLPGNASKRYLSTPLGSFKDDNYDIVIFVANSSDFQQDLQMPNKLSNFAPSRHDKVFAVAIDPVGGISNHYGKVYFYTYSELGFQLSGEAFYFSQNQLLGAVFSGSPSIYRCQFDKSVKRLNLVSMLHSERVSKLLNDPSIAASCPSQYSSIASSLDEIVLDTTGNIDFNKVNKIFEGIQAIEILNKEVIDLTECPPIY